MMVQAETKLAGSCLCGTVQYEISGECSNMLHCHCRLCRKSHGSLFATFTAIKKESLQFKQGKSHIRSHAFSEHLSRNWCDICGTTLPFLEGENYSVPAGTLIDPCESKVMGHIFVGSKAPWYEITDELRQYETFPKSMMRAEIATVPPDPDISGSCACGACEFKVTGEPNLMMNCHCTRCQRSRAAAHATNVFFAESQLEWIKGKEHLEDYKLPDAERFGSSFCKFCGSLLPRINRSGTSDARYTVPAGCLDKDPGIRPAGHIFVDSKKEWFEISGDLPTFQQSIR